MDDTHIREHLVALQEAATVEEVVQALLSGVRAATVADTVAIVLRDGDWCFRLYVDEDGSLLRGPTTALDGVVAGAAIRHRSLMLMPEIPDSAKFAAGDVSHIERTAAIMPIRLANPMGVVNAFWRGYHWIRETEALQSLMLGELAGERLTRIPYSSETFVRRSYQVGLE